MVPVPSLPYTVQISHVSFDPMTVEFHSADPQAVTLVDRVVELPGVDIYPEEKGLPWWAWALIGYGTGKAFKLW